MITIRDMLDAGIQLQGREIIVKEWHDDENDYTELYRVEDELLGVDNVALDMEVIYIYPMDRNLIIEVEAKE